MRVRRKSDIRLSSVRASHVICPDCPLSVFSRRHVLLRRPLNSQDNLFAVERVDFLRCGRPLVAGIYALPGLRVDQSTRSLERVSIISPCEKISSLLPLGRRAALASLGMLRSCLRHGFQGSSKACIFEELWKSMTVRLRVTPSVMLASYLYKALNSGQSTVNGSVWIFSGAVFPQGCEALRPKWNSQD